MARRITTRAEIIKTAAEAYLKNGYTNTSIKSICDKIGISTGNLTFYFPTKEHILAVLVKMMIDFQWKEMESQTDEGKSSLLAYCLELSTLAAICDEFPEMKDFITAAYAHPMTLDLIRANDTEKIKKVFCDYTENWSDEKYITVEAIISGIEYATVMQTEYSASLEHRIEGALDTVMSMFGVSVELRRAKLARVLAMDYRSIGRKVYGEFKKYVTETNEQALEEVLSHTKIRTYK